MNGMNESQPLAVLLSQSERQRDAALDAHQRARTASEAAATQAEQLRGYRREYEQRWQAQFRSGGEMALVLCYQSFMERLTHAVDQQVRIAEQAAVQAGLALAALRECELRCASVRKLMERRAQAERTSADRLEQRRHDEHASRAAWDHAQATGRH